MVRRKPVSRRRLLAGLASGPVLVALSGCADNGGSAPTTDDSDGEGGTGSDGEGGTESDGENGATVEPPAGDDLDLREANVVAVAFEATDEGYAFDVTLHHDDDGRGVRELVADRAARWDAPRSSGTAPRAHRTAVHAVRHRRRSRRCVLRRRSRPRPDARVRRGRRRGRSRRRRDPVGRSGVRPALVRRERLSVIHTSAGGAESSVTRYHMTSRRSGHTPACGLCTGGKY